MQKRAVYWCKFGFFEMCYEAELLTRFKRLPEAVQQIQGTQEAQDMGEKSPFSDAVFAEILEYFAGERKVFSFSYAGEGTPFQQKVWKALCDIPYGETRSYKDIAVAIGNEKACRAVGMANNKNPIGVVVPCHRVIGSTGKLVGYASGVEMKAYLLALEARCK